MKSNRILALIVIILIVVMFGFYRFVKNHIKNESVKNKEEASIENTIEDKVGLNKVKTGLSNVKSASTKEMESISRPPNIDESTWEVILRKHKFGLEINSPIDFFGKVVDQNGEAISNVRVKLEILGYDETYIYNVGKEGADQKIEKLDRYTDKDGRFFIKGYNGQSMVIETIEKDGYISPLNFNKSFDFSRKLYPDTVHQRSEEPVLFKMWKKSYREVASGTKKEQKLLIKQKIKIFTMADGERHYLDLIKNEEVDSNNKGYDLEVRVYKKDNNRKYDWSFVLEAYRGGIVETDALLMFKAPDDGYKKIYEKIFNPSQENYSYSINNTRLYLNSRDGQIYAALEVTVHTYDDGKALIKISSVVNPNGSTNLECVE